MGEPSKKFGRKQQEEEEEYVPCFWEGPELVGVLAPVMAVKIATASNPEYSHECQLPCFILDYDKQSLEVKEKIGPYYKHLHWPVFIIEVKRLDRSRGFPVTGKFGIVPQSGVRAITQRSANQLSANLDAAADVAICRYFNWTNCENCYKWRYMPKAGGVPKAGGGAHSRFTCQVVHETNPCIHGCDSEAEWGADDVDKDEKATSKRQKKS